MDLETTMIFSMRLAKVILLFSIMFFCSCYNDDKKIYDVLIFKDTVSWELAKSVDSGNLAKINELADNNEHLINVIEPKYGITLLEWAVRANKKASAKALLLNGADPNIRSRSGRTPLFSSSGPAWDENSTNQNPDILKLLLKNGADPNLNFYKPNKLETTSIIENGTSPLMHAVSFGSLEKVKVLVQSGAEINYKNQRGVTASVVSLLMERVEIAHYLIVEQKADISEEFYAVEIGNIDRIDSSKVHKPVKILENWIFELGSEKHSTKLEIVDEFKNQGVDYWSEKKSERIVEQIKMLYPNTWEKYLEEY